MGGQYENNGSQHDDNSKLKNFENEEDGDVNAATMGSGGLQWQDVKMVHSDAGSQELVIENLENIGDGTALIVTREGGQFKIGI